MSLYTIEQELLELFAHIEENDGEITEEMYAQLNITKENLYTKLANYVKAIKSWNGDVVTIKAEVKSLSANAKVRENRVERLKKAMLQAVQLFGNDGKSGNKFIDLPTVKIFTKGSQAIQTDDPRIRILIMELSRLIEELVGNDVLYTGQDVDLVGLLDIINANIKAQYDFTGEVLVNIDREPEFIPYTLSDLTTLKLEISCTHSVYDLFRSQKAALILYGKNPIHTEIRDHTPKEDWKTAIEIANTINTNPEEDYSYPTVAKIVKNESIQIR